MAATGPLQNTLVRKLYVSSLDWSLFQKTENLHKVFAKKRAGLHKPALFIFFQRLFFGVFVFLRFRAVAHHQNHNANDDRYQCIPAWDSVGHMGMIAELEETFDILLETDDIIDFSSYTKGIEILAKYKVSI